MIDGYNPQRETFGNRAGYFQKVTTGFFKKCQKICWWKNFLDFLLLIKMIHEELWESKDTKTINWKWNEKFVQLRQWLVKIYRDMIYVYINI